MATSARALAPLSAVLLTLAVSTGVASAEPMYTIDTITDSLFVIDSGTGRIVQRVGDLGVNLVDCPSLCTTPGGLIYCLYSTSSGVRHFAEISRVSGEVIQDFTLYVEYAEGLADDPMTGQLYITYGLNELPTLSDRLGIINPMTGAITDLGRLEFREDSNEDGDEIRFDDSGQMYLMNSLCCGNGCDVYRMHGLTGTWLGRTILPVSDINYMDFLTDGRLIALDNADDVLMTVSTVDGSISDYVTCQSMYFTGLARVKSGPVATRPTTWGEVKAIYR